MSVVSFPTKITLDSILTQINIIYNKIFRFESITNILSIFPSGLTVTSRGVTSTIINDNLITLGIMGQGTTISQNMGQLRISSVVSSPGFTSSNINDISTLNAQELILGRTPGPITTITKSQFKITNLLQETSILSNEVRLKNATSTSSISLNAQNQLNVTTSVKTPLIIPTNIQDISGNSVVIGNVLSSTAGGIKWVPPSFPSIASGSLDMNNNDINNCKTISNSMGTLTVGSLGRTISVVGNCTINNLSVGSIALYGKIENETFSASGSIGNGSLSNLNKTYFCLFNGTPSQTLLLPSPVIAGYYLTIKNISPYDVNITIPSPPTAPPTFIYPPGSGGVSTYPLLSNHSITFYTISSGYMCTSYA